MSGSPRRLYLVLGDQLDHDSPILREGDPATDAIWMAEAEEESNYVWSHKLRLAFFFAAMRHFRSHLEREGWTVHYTALTADPKEDRGRGFREILSQDLSVLKPAEVVVVEAGDHRVTGLITDACGDAGVPLRWLEDSHFYLPREDFAEWAAGRKTFLLEHFYRMMRKRFDILVDSKGKPEGGEWNYDHDNRESFGRSGPPPLPKFGQYPADEITEEVVRMVQERFANHPGRLDTFTLPVTREAAREELERFVEERLPLFGRYEDALWSGAQTLFHSRLSAVLNLKLLHPGEVLQAVLAAYENGAAPLEAVEGYVRQVLGWREFVRGVYQFFGAEYLERNALDATAELPSFFWDGETEMACVRDAMKNVLENGYAHHIQRLMVLGQFSLLWGAHPRHFHEWHVAMYLDAIDWASAPNTIGMSQYADGGIVGTKPYCASGNYIKRMSNHCAGCRYRPEKAAGEDACPFTTLYYAFLDRHAARFEDNRRMTFQLKNLNRKSPEDLAAILSRAEALRMQWS